MQRVYSHLGFGLFMALMLGVSGAYASVTGSISGTVADPSGAVISGASVVALNMDTGVKQPTQTNSAGYYVLPQLPVGRYELIVQAAGFQEYRQSGLVLNDNSALGIDVTMKLGSTTQAVAVSATAVHVDTSSTQMGEVIGSTKIAEVPLNGRSYTDLLALQPGVVPQMSGEFKSFSASGDLDPGNLSVSGQQEGSNGFMVNGGNVEEHMNNGTAIVPNLDSIAEFRILTNNVNAEYGNYSGGLVSVITKSGTNSVHGGAFEFLRNSDMDSRNFFSPSRGTLHQNQFGGDVGGPILKDKLFFFADYQGTRQIVGVDSGVIPVPSAQDRMGNLSDIASSLTGSVSGPYWAGVLSQGLGYPVSAGEPYYTSGCTTSSQCVLPNAVIPQSAFSSPASPLMKYIPLPNDGDNFTTSAYPQTLQDDKGSIKIDASTRLGMITGYYFMDQYALNNPYPQANLPGFNAENSGRAQMFNLADIKTFGSNKVNELRLSYMRNAYNINIPIGGLGPSLTSLGFVQGGSGIVNTAPQVGVPQVSLNNFTIGFSNGYRIYFNNTYEVSDNFSDVIGKHTVKFGGEYHRDQFNATCYYAAEGAFGFNGIESGDDFADFLLGAPENYNQVQQVPAYDRGYYYALYLQDSWRVKKQVTVNYGLRYEVASPWYEKNNRNLETAIPGEQSKVFPTAPTGWLVPLDPGIPRTLAPVRNNNFAPRIGLAYAPSVSSGLLGKLLGGPDKTSFRASYGVFFTSFIGRTVPNMIGAPPTGVAWFSPTPPLFATPFIDRSTGNDEGQRFPGGIPSPDVGPSNPDPNYNWANVEPISGDDAFLHTNRLPYTEEYSFSIERQFGSGTLLTLSYVGTQAHRLMSGLEMNPSNQAACLSISQLSEVVPGTSTCGPESETGTFHPIGGGTLVPRQTFGADFGPDEWEATMGNSNYNALEVNLRRSVGRFEFLAGYTYSKVLALTSGIGCCGLADTIDPYDHQLSKGLAAFDMTHNFVISYNYQLPIDKLMHGSRLTSGWTLTGITHFSTGLPVQIRESDDRSLIGDGQNLDAPNYTPGNLGFVDPRKANLTNYTNPYFNTSLFSQETLGVLGTSSHFFFHGPGTNNWDIALSKSLRVTESKSFLIRFETFNAFNHAQFENPAGNINTQPGFGFVTNANPARICQASAKFLF